MVMQYFKLLLNHIQPPSLRIKPLLIRHILRHRRHTRLYPIRHPHHPFWFLQLPNGLIFYLNHSIFIAIHSSDRRPCNMVLNSDIADEDDMLRNDIIVISLYKHHKQTQICYYSFHYCEYNSKDRMYDGALFRYSK
jgi:hypothetical protein